MPATVRSPLDRRHAARAFARAFAIAGAIGGALALAGCSDGPGGPGATRPLTLCTAAEWFAYRNDGGEWTRLESATGVYTFPATARLAVAAARFGGSSPVLRVRWLTSEQARAQLACVSRTAAPTIVSGSVQGLADGDYADVSFGGSVASLPWHEPEFALDASAGRSDLVATRFPTRGSADRIDRAIIRRAQSYPAGWNILLDFASGESFAPAQHELRWTGPSAHVQVDYFTAAGNANLLQSTIVGDASGPASGEAARVATLYTIPTQRQVAGDVHRVMVSSGDRAVWLYQRERSADRTVSHGPPANAPTFAAAATSLRAEVVSQAAYDAHVELTIAQLMAGGAGRRFVTLSASREYFGRTPRTWTLAMPDLTTLPGFDADAALTAGEFDWSIALSSEPAGFSALAASDGFVARTASASGRGP